MLEIMNNYGAIEDQVTKNTTGFSFDNTKNTDGKKPNWIGFERGIVDVFPSSRILLRCFLLPSLVVLLVVSIYLYDDETATKTYNDRYNGIPKKEGKIKTHPMSFDYIVVGAGPSGIVTAVNLARRLEEEEKKTAKTGTEKESKVLLIESGTLSQSSVLKALKNMGSEGRYFNAESAYKGKYADPLLLHNLDVNEEVYTDSSFDLNKFDVPYYWNDLSKQQTKGGRNEQSFYSLHHWPINQTFLGRAVGGSGIHNAMINIRALPSDFDRWNVTNWTSEILMPYFDEMESYDYSNYNVSFWANSTSEHFDDKNRGHDGPISVQQAGSAKMILDPVAPSFVSSALAAGFPLASIGFNGRDEEMRKGAGLYEFNIRNGLRDSVASALLSEDRKGYAIPKNLVIWTGCTAHKVLFDTTTSKPRAVGLLFDSGNANDLFKVMLKNSVNNNRKSEMILAAGAILTPQLLSNSGIRDGGEISDLKAVGKNLQDHPVVAMAFEENEAFEQEVSESTETSAISKTEYLNALHNLRANSVETPHDFVESENLGVLGTATFSAGAFLVSPWSFDDNPDIQLTVFPKTQEPHYYKNLAKKKKSQSKQNMLVTVALLRPQGRRTVHMAPYTLGRFNLPTLRPTKNSEYLTELDIKRIVWGIRQVRKIMSQNPLANQTSGEVFPGVDMRSDADLKTFVSQDSMTNSHWCGSTKMGKDIEDSVVDDQLRVHNVDSFRIVDTGIMPFIPNGNTHSTTCAVARRAVDLIFRDSWI